MDFNIQTTFEVLESCKKNNIFDITKVFSMVKRKIGGITEKEYTKFVRLALCNGESPTKEKILLLSQQDSDGCRLLLFDRYISEYINTGGQNPLHILAYRGISEVIHHPDCAKSRDTENSTPLHYLAKWGDEDNYPYVLKHSECSKVKDNDGMTPLHYLASHSSMALMHLDCSIVRNKHGRTPLHMMAFHGIEESKKHPSYSTVEDFHGLTPKQMFEMRPKR